MNDTKLGRLLRWQRGETPGPWEVVVFPTNRCNLRCNICWQRWAEAEFGKVDLTEVPDERLLRLVEEGAAMDVREWTLVGGGEPMVRAPLVMAMCRRIRELGMNGSVFSNGTLFTREHFETLVSVGWNRVDFSLDGPDTLSNDAIRSEGSFERATANIRLLADLKRRHNRAKPEIMMHAIITGINCERLDEMVQLAHDLGCDAGFYVTDLLMLGDRCREFQLNAAQKSTPEEHLRRARVRIRGRWTSHGRDVFRALAEHGGDGGWQDWPLLHGLGERCRGADQHLVARGVDRRSPQ